MCQRCVKHARVDVYVLCACYLIFFSYFVFVCFQALSMFCSGTHCTQYRMHNILHMTIHTCVFKICGAICFTSKANTNRRIYWEKGKNCARLNTSFSYILKKYMRRCTKQWNQYYRSVLLHSIRYWQSANSQSNDQSQFDISQHRKLTAKAKAKAKIRFKNICH